MPIIRHGYSTTPNKDNHQRRKARNHTRNNATHCALCGQPFTPNDTIEADHITPISAGGTDHTTNLRATHRTCNRRRGQG